MCKRKEMSTRLADNGTDICKAEVPDDDSSRVDFRQVSDQVTASVKQNLAIGNAIRTFYHVNDHPCKYRHERLGSIVSHQMSSQTISVWSLCLRVVFLPHPEEDRIPSKFLETLNGQFADPFESDFEPVQNVHNMYWEDNREHVSRLDEIQVPAKESVFVMRWWTCWNAKHRTSRSHIVANEKMILAVVEEIGSKHGVLAFGQVVALEFPRVFNENCEVRGDFL